MSEKIIRISVKDRYALAEGNPVIICGNSGYSVEFTFDPEWDSYEVKTARFVYVKRGEVKYQDVVFAGTTAVVPILSNIQAVHVGVFADDLSTTTPARIPCRFSVRCGTGAPEDPTPSQYDQIMALLRLSDPENLVRLNQGAEHAGQVLTVGEDGRVVPADPPASNTETDTTLTQSGKAADAKAVGDMITEQGKTIPKVFDWANAELPFTENEISGVASGGGFGTNHTNFADGKTYFRYHAGASYGFRWTNPNQQKGSLTITMRGYSQYSTTLSTAIITVYTDGTESRILLRHGETVTYTTDPNKTVDYIRGNYDFENWVLLDMDALSIVADYPAPTGTVKTVNGVEPDENGNVEIPVSGGTLVEPAEDDIPKVFFGGALQQTKDEAVVPFRYISKTEDISGYAEIKAQGNSSMSYPKKNQTVKLYKDKACTEKLKIDFKEWGKQSKFCFKANWIDLTHARNVVSARLWADVVKSRSDYEELPELLRTSPNQGAVNGFPIKVYANGVYQGRYTANIPKDAWMANMDDELDNHCILCGENYVSGCFRAAANINGSDWTDEVHDAVPASIKTRWNEIISFVMNSTDEEFKANLGSYFYVDSLIDYYLFGLVSCGLDAFGKNQLYMTYNGQKWIATMYDMDSTWGLWWTGASFVATDYDRSEYQDFKDGAGNLLFIRLEELFCEAIKTRWEDLKHGALSIENIINRFERFTDIAPAELVKEDYASTTGGGKFTGIPSQSTNNIQQLRTYANARLAWTNEYVAALTGGEVDPDEPDEPVVPDEPTDGMLYSLPEATTFNGTSDYIDTGVQLFDTNKDFTILVEFKDNYETSNGGNENKFVLQCCHEINPWPGVSLFVRGKYGITGRLELGIAQSMAQKERVVIVKDASAGTITARSAYATEIVTDTRITSAIISESLLLGAYQDTSGTKGRFWSGTIYQCDVHNRKFTDEEITAYLFDNGGDEPDEPVVPDLPDVPSGYTAVEYIQSDGNQYIDTGVSGGTNAAWEIKMNALGAFATNYETYICGTKNGTIPNLYCETNFKIASSNVAGPANSLNVLDYNVHTYEYRGTKNIYVDGEPYDVLNDPTGNGWGTSTWYVFSSHGEPNLKSSMRLYYFKMWTDGVLVRDFVPVVRNSDNSIGLYDLANDMFYENIGTGTFVVPNNDEYVPQAELIYNMPEATTFNGTSDYIDTGVQLMSTAKSMNICIDCDFTDDVPNDSTIFHCKDEVTPYNGISLCMNSARNYGVVQQSTRMNGIPAGRRKIVIRFVSGCMSYVKYYDGGTITTIEQGGNYGATDRNLLIGCHLNAQGNKIHFWTGTIYDFKVYEGTMSDSDIEAYLNS